MTLLICQRCLHPEDTHPGHGSCRFHTCECERFESTQHMPPLRPTYDAK